MKKTLIAQALAMVLTMTPTFTQAGGVLQSQMDSVFESMINVSQPGAFESQRRGVLTGGSVAIRNKVVDTHIVTLVPPSWKGGCGGIDFFGGSFSFIDADQFIQLMRAVASNASGYAFQLALDNTCPQCMTFINDLRKVIQTLNEYAANSCQLAQGIVNDIAPAHWTKSRTDASIGVMVQGLKTDIFDANSEKDGTSSFQTATKDPKTSAQVFGNIVWQELNKNNVAKWFTQSFGNKQETYEMLMSLTGSVVIDEPKETAVGNGGKSDTTPIRTLQGTIHLEELIEGGNVQLYKCDDPDKCLNPGFVNSTLSSLRDKIYNTLVGTPKTTGLITAYADRTGTVKVSDEAKALSAAIPQAAGVLIRNLSLRSEDTARSFAVELSYALAADMSLMMVNDMFEAVSNAVSTSQKPQTEKVIKSITDRRRAFMDEYLQYGQKHPTLAQMIQYYNNINPLMRNPELTAEQALPTTK